MQRMQTTFHTVILGAGMSGLCMAIELKRQGLHDFVVLEKSQGLGGTWWDNRYPGAQVDVPAPLYCFSFEPNPRWQRRFAAAAEIHAYMAHCAAKYGVNPHIRLGTTITGARFEETSGLWHISTRVGEHAGPSLVARFFVCSTGPLSQARWPAIEGLQDFKGQLVHAAQWPRNQPTNQALAIAGQRVGVIGTGSTAAQLIPELASLTSTLSTDPGGTLTVFQRTANWVLPRVDRPYGNLDRVLSRLPGYQAVVRRCWYHVLEWGRRGFETGTLARRGMVGAAQALLKHHIADPVLRARLTPNYPLGCKRIIYSNHYHRSFTLPHVRLVTEGISAVTASGVRTADGRHHALDMLVCATGFDVQHSLAAVPITGLAGRSLQSAWPDGPQAVLGLTVAGFPNLFFMLGPNTATGHTSTLLYIEPGVRWAVQAMQEVQRQGKRWLAVKDSHMQQFNTQLQSRLSTAVWSQCHSWYRAETAQGQVGRNIAIWPGFTAEYVRAVQGQSFSQFDFG
jgi:cation diffusion facilitator CzcD-associated flavoprotein CzcO